VIRRIKKGLYRIEDFFAIAVLAIMVILPLIQIISRKFFGVSIVGGDSYFQHGTLWITFVGASLVARRGRHLRFAAMIKLPQRWEIYTKQFYTVVSVAVTTVFVISSASLVQIELEAPSFVAPFLPTWLAQLPMVLFMVSVTIHTLIRSNLKVKAILVVIFLSALILCLNYVPEESRKILTWPGITLLLIALLFGAPLFVIMGGMAFLLFFIDGGPLMAVPSEAYRMVSSPNLPTIPLFTLVGCILAEGGSSKRLITLFRAIFGWIPGGVPIAALIVCAFFTTFTGASGVTILALGGLLFPILIKAKYSENFSLGLITSSGSAGMLFPPALPIILYGVIAGVPINKMFLAGITPGIVLLTVLAIYIVYISYKQKIERIPFSWHETKTALKLAKWDIVFPIVVLWGIFGGFATVVETAAMAALYAIITECFIHRKLQFTKELPKTMVKATVLIGGVMIILGFAFGFTSYLIDAQIPSALLEWVKGAISSKVTFLLALNVFLIAVGCIMDIFSAIVVIVPIMIPIAIAYGIDPLHLGVIFLINMELGYLTPPVGLNLFLSAFRFNKPLSALYKPVIPFILLRLVVLALITYIPWLTLWIIND
jgi:tripartite ATP-independent transporter DctM subunit